LTFSGLTRVKPSQNYVDKKGHQFRTQGTAEGFPVDPGLSETLCTVQKHSPKSILATQSVFQSDNFRSFLVYHESRGSNNEAESDGEDIEDVEFHREEESSDEETLQDRAIKIDLPQPLGRSSVCVYAVMDAELWPSDTESSMQLEGRKRSERGESDQSTESQLRGRGRRRVVMSSSLSSEAEADESDSEEGGQSVTSSEWGDLHDDDDHAWDLDDEHESGELRENFSVCRIDLHLGQDYRESLAPQVCPLSSVVGMSFHFFLKNLRAEA
jgi:hypothetical protein